MGPLTWWSRVAPVGPATTALSPPPHQHRLTVPWELTVPMPVPASPCVLKVCILITQKMNSHRNCLFFNKVMLLNRFLEVKPFMLISFSHLSGKKLSLINMYLNFTFGVKSIALSRITFKPMFVLPLKVCVKTSSIYLKIPVTGTYSNATNLQNVSDCSPCPGGQYCETDGLTTPTGLCGEGYYCPEGSIYKEPATSFCPVGHFCPEGVSQPVPCRNYSEVGSRSISLIMICLLYIR